MSDIKSQSEAMMAMVEQQQLERQEQKDEQRRLKIERDEQQAEQRQKRAEQRRLNAETDARFIQMLQASIQQSTQGIPPSPLPPPLTIVISPTAVAAPPTQAVRTSV